MNNQYSQLKLMEGKNPDRVSKVYLEYHKEWQAQYDMLLLDGITCKDCVHRNRCCTIFGSKETDTSCQFYPSKYRNGNPPD